MTKAHLPIPVLNVETASPNASDLLKAAQAKYGFVPNLLGVMANAPALLEGYLMLSGVFEKTSLSPTERQIVLLAASFENECDYCMAAHTAIAGMQKVDPAVISALRNNTPISDARLEALRRLVRETVRSRGWPSREALAAFSATGYSAAQALEVVLGIGLKTLSNYANHLAATPLDPAFESHRPEAPAAPRIAFASTPERAGSRSSRGSSV